MRSAIHYIPIATTIFSLAFVVVIFRHWMGKKGATYLAWWTGGIFVYGTGTATESLITLFGWSDAVFRAWYISGALMGGVLLAQGTVYLLLSRKIANVLSIVLLAFIFSASVCVLLTPINYSLVEQFRPTGKVIEWTWVRTFSPFINTYSVIFLVGGAAWSAWKYWKRGSARSRVQGNILIAVGAILPGIGGSFTRFGHTEVLYVTEFVGILLIFAGYRTMRDNATESIYDSQRLSAQPAPSPGRDIFNRDLK